MSNTIPWDGIALWSLALWVLFGRRLHNLIRRPYIPLSIPDDFTPRIVGDQEDGGVLVKIGNTPHFIVTSERDALAMKGIRDERK